MSENEKKKGLKRLLEESKRPTDPETCLGVGYGAGWKDGYEAGAASMGAVKWRDQGFEDAKVEFSQERHETLGGYLVRILQMGLLRTNLSSNQCERINYVAGDHPLAVLNPDIGLKEVASRGEGKMNPTPLHERSEAEQAAVLGPAVRMKGEPSIKGLEVKGDGKVEAVGLSAAAPLDAKADLQAVIAGAASSLRKAMADDDHKATEAYARTYLMLLDGTLR